MGAIEGVKTKPSNKKWWVLASISFALFMILLDVTIVNIAIPHIMTSLNVSLSSIEWVINVYVLVFAVLLLTLGKLGDLFGRKLLFMIGLAVFTLASLGCTLAPNFVFLVIGRGIQAIGGAAMLPATLSILNVEFGKSGRGLALGVWGAVAGAANALGPIIGGSLVDAFDWRYIFLINVPIGVIAFIAAFIVIRESKDEKTDRHIDFRGIIIFSVALFCLTFALVEGQSYGWTSLTILSLFGIALVGFIVFVIIELKTASPLAQLRLFKDKTFSAGNFIGLVINFGLIGVIFLLVLYLQIVLKIDALTAGLWILPLPLSIIVIAPFAGRFTDKIGGRWILFAGTLLSALGIFLMSDLLTISTWTDLLVPLIILGVGIGMVMAPVTTVVMSSTPIQQSGMGAGLLSTTRQIGAVMGISVLGAILQSQLVTNVTNALAQYSMVPSAIRDKIVSGVTSGGMNIGAGSIPADIPFKDQLTELFKTQFANSLSTAMQVGVIVLLLGTIASLFVASHIQKTKKPVSSLE
jgi:EmrB/QacA subfamily drug resistance transporter